LLVLAKKINLPNRPTSQLPLVRTRWQEFSSSAIALSLDPKIMLSSRVSPLSCGRERDLLSIESFVPPIWGRFAFSGAPPLLRGGRFCFAGRGFMRFVLYRAITRNGSGPRKTVGAKSCIMNTCAKTGRRWGFMNGSYRRRMGNSVVANREAKCRGLISLHEDAKQLPWNDILAEKHRGVGGRSTETLILLAANVYLQDELRGVKRVALFAERNSAGDLTWV
jgi:hypothetical protein